MLHAPVKKVTLRPCVRMLRAEVCCNDIARSGHFEDETAKAVTEEQKKAMFFVLSGRDTFVCLQTGLR